MGIRTLPSKFAQIVALMDGSTFEHERITARTKATELAESLGWSFDAALRATPRAKPRDLPPTRAEATAAAAMADAERAEEEKRLRDCEIKLSPLIKLYGSIERAFAPCWREKILIDAVVRWSVREDGAYRSWTHTLDGSFDCRVSDRVRHAVSFAIPLPQTVAFARMEYDYWLQRGNELGLLLRMLDGYEYEDALDLVASVRKDIVSRLLFETIPARNLQELEQRICGSERLDPPTSDEWSRLREDVSMLAAFEREHSNYKIKLDVRCRIMREIHIDKDLSDREIARRVKCSPTTVGRCRKTLLQS